MVEAAGHRFERVATDEAQAWRIAWNSESERERLSRRFVLEDCGREYLQFFGKRRQSGQHATSPDDDNLARLFNQPQCNFGVALPCPSGRAASARIDERMRGAPIAPARLAIVLDDISPNRAPAAAKNSRAA